MKVFPFLILFVFGTTYAQKIDHSNLLGDWSRCLKDSADNSKTLVFMNPSVLDADSCACKRINGDWERLNELTYDFKPANQLGIIGRATGGWLSENYVQPEPTWVWQVTRNTITKKEGDTITTIITIDSVKTPQIILIQCLGPASIYSTSSYELIEKNNKLIIMDDRKLKYRIIELSERWMRLKLLN